MALQWCLNADSNGAGLQLPSSEEINAALSGRKLTSIIFFLDETFEEVQYDIATTVLEAAEQLAGIIKLREFSTFTLYELRKVLKLSCCCCLLRCLLSAALMLAGALRRMIAFCRAAWSLALYISFEFFAVFWRRASSHAGHIWRVRLLCWTGYMAAQQQAC